MQNKRINQNNKMRPAMGKMILATVQKQTQEAPRKQGGEAISSISVQSEKLCVKQTNSARTHRAKETGGNNTVADKRNIQ